MNEIIKKHKIPGHEIKVIIEPRNDKTSNLNNGFQLSLDLEVEPSKPVKVKNV